MTMTTASVVGLLTGLSAVVFRWLIDHIQDISFEYWLDGAQGYSSWHLMLAPALGGVVVGYLVYGYAREAKGHGVPEVMEAVALQGGRIRPVVALIKALASSVCIGTGGSAGREGPIVQIGSSLGSTLGQTLRLSDERVINLVACGAAGGIAATFNAPIAGAIFAMEIILGRLHTLYFGAVVVSAVIADVVARSYEGDIIAFTVPNYSLVHPSELALYALLGLLAALLAVGFTRGLYAIEDFWDALPVWNWTKPAMGGALLGLVGIASYKLDGFPRVFGAGVESMTTAVLGNLALDVVFALLFLKMIATALTLGSGGSGGVFAPSLFMGAMLGSSFGQMAHQIFPTTTASSGAYALVGMSAFFSAAAYAPVTAILIVFEMTRDYAIILPLMLATVVATVIARLISNDSIYTLKLTRRGIRLQQGLDVDVLEGVRVAEIMNTAIAPVRLTLPLESLNAEFNRARDNTIPVVDAAGRLAGIVSTQDLDRALSRGSIEGKTVEDAATLDELLVIQPEESIGEALNRLEVRGLSMLPVVEAGHPRRLLGVVTREDLKQAYDRGVSRRTRHVQRAAESGIEDGQDMNLIYLDVPPHAHIGGTPVSELRLPRECLLVSLERNGQRSLVHGDTHIHGGDRVAVVVNRESATKVREMFTSVPADETTPPAETVTPASESVPPAAEPAARATENAPERS
ncbi:MAG: chloride channel protein [Acidobacteriota bacterium]